MTLASRFAFGLTMISMASAFMPSTSGAQSASAIYRFESTYQTANNYTSSIFGLGADVALSTTTKIMPRVQRLNRTFTGGAKFEESTLGLGLAQVTGQNSYVLLDSSVTPNAQILARWTAAVDPHLTFGSTDVGLRVGASSYVDLNAAIFAPSYFYAVTDNFFLSEMVTAVRSDRWSVSSSSQLVYRPSKSLLVRGGGAFGETLENAGLAAHFKSLSLETLYDLSRHLRIGIGGTAYESTLRTEQSILLRIEAL